jgi:hypothetical protein
VANARLQDAFARRFNAATRQALVPIPAQPTNGDEALADKCATYTKCVKQAGPGKVDFAAYALFRAATLSGAWTDYEAIPLGGGRTLNGPMDCYATNFMGADSVQFGLPEVPAPPGLASKAYATELVELYWCSLLRDCAFSGYAESSVAEAAAKELSGLPEYAGPRDAAGKVTPALLFRGGFVGETVGPYLSQFLVAKTNLGALPIEQKYVTYKAGVDYLTDEASWFLVQNGGSTGLSDQAEPEPKYLHNGRGLAAYTHVDELFQAYLTAYLVLRSMGAPVNPGNPYLHSKTQNGFGTFAPPDFAAMLAQVAKMALGAVWYQKWVVHLRHRPEAGAGLVQLVHGGATFSAQPDGLVFASEGLRRSHAKYGSYLLSQPFPEGSPSHPAYPTGHGTVGGACITLLKFFFDGGFVLKGTPQVPSHDGTTLKDWSGEPSQGAAGALTVNGELHKLAHNVTFAHGLHGGIHWRSDSDSSITLGEAVALSFLSDLACTYAEPFTVSFTKLDGSMAVIGNQ